MSRTHPNIIIAFAILIALIPSESLSSPTQAAQAKISAFSPSSAAAQGGTVIRVKGTNLQNVKKVRVAGTIQGILTSKSNSGFSFVLPKLPWVTRKYGGLVETEIFEAGEWKTMKTRFLATAPRQKKFTSGPLTYRVLDYDVAEFAKVNKFTHPHPWGFDETVTSVPADWGNSFYIVKASVLNNSDSAVDLECGNLIEIVLLNRKLQSFKHDLNGFTFQGNPECNDLKNPGSETIMGWAFEMDETFGPVAVRINTVDKNGIPGRTVYLNFWG
jgi:hypothetical protein